MKIFTSISFSILFLIQGVMPDVNIYSELQKLPGLFDHYEEHKDCYDNSFVQFLIDDYLDEDQSLIDSNDHHDKQDHENLPFQGGSHQCMHVCVFYPAIYNFSFPPAAILKPAQPDYFNPIFTSQFQGSLFQPPRV